MKAIVTGGAGFVGSHLCDKLLEQNYQVLCLDNLITGSEENIKHVYDNPNFTFLNFDVVTENLPEEEAYQTVDEIYHLASPASPNIHSAKSYHSLPFETMKVNTQGTWNMAELAVRRGAKFLFASSSEIYGEPQEHPQKETYRGNVSTTGPRAVYDEAKRFGETITSSFVRAKNLDGRIIRIFNTYGPRMAPDDGRAISEFIQKAAKNEPISIFGDGTQTRSFCYISDLVEGIIAAMQKGQKGEIYNLGNPEECKIIDLAQKVKEMTGSNSEIKSTEALPQDDPTRRQPDITKARTELSWEPKITLSEGLPKTIEYYKKLS